MEPPRREPVTQLLLRWRRGDRECLDQLVPLVEGELRRIARHYMLMERSGHTLQTTALVNEAYIRLVDQAQVDWQNRAQFLAIAARLMRQILVDHARKLRRGKRGGGARLLPLNEGLIFSPAKSAALVALDEALQQLAGLDPRKAQIVCLNIQCQLRKHIVASDWAEAVNRWLQIPDFVDFIWRVRGVPLGAGESVKTVRDKVKSI